MAAPGEGQAELRMLPVLGHWRRAHDVIEVGLSQRRGESIGLTQLGHDSRNSGDDKLDCNARTVKVLPIPSPGPATP